MQIAETETHRLTELRTNTRTAIVAAGTSGVLITNEVAVAIPLGDKSKPDLSERSNVHHRDHFLQ